MERRIFSVGLMNVNQKIDLLPAFIENVETSIIQLLINKIFKMEKKRYLISATTSTKIVIILAL